jgi:hypothetical protein
MNSYTGSVVHYWLAAVFAIFGASINAMRGAYAAMNLSALGLIVALLWRQKEKSAAVWFTLLWAVLPLSVHNHRFYIEVTGFFGFCFALVLWGLELWEKRPAIAFVLLFFSTIFATYSHILFVAVFAAGLFILPRHFPARFLQFRSRVLVAAIAVALVPLAIRMGWGLQKTLPYALAATLVATAVCALFRPTWIGIVSRTTPVLAFLATPFLVSFLLLQWNGAWPYAQATGHLSPLWLIPVNIVLFLGLVIAEYRRKPRAKDTLAWDAFLATFFFSSLIILKQTPHYYIVPVMTAMIWAARRLSALSSLKTACAIAFVILGWNLFAFQRLYIAQYEKEGPTSAEFRVGLFHDNGRDFRPFQKVFAWLEERGCQFELKWVEDDRIGHPFHFLQHTAPQPKTSCPWTSDQLFFSHLENYDPSSSVPRTAENTPPPSWANHVKLLAHFREWGDLAIYEKSSVSSSRGSRSADSVSGRPRSTNGR